MEHWVLAEWISKTGHANSGYPAMYDSIYHAIAIEASGVFITADRKHYSKANSFGSICLLENWESVVTND